MQDRFYGTLMNNLNSQNALSGFIHRQIALLREYRQALITAAVTGQIDVTDCKAEAICP